MATTPGEPGPSGAEVPTDSRARPRCGSGRRARGGVSRAAPDLCVPSVRDNPGLPGQEPSIDAPGSVLRWHNRYTGTVLKGCFTGPGPVKLGAIVGRSKGACPQYHCVIAPRISLMAGFTTTWRTTWLAFGLVLATASVAGVASRRIASAHARDVRVGTGRAYALLGDLPVKHRDRVKPLSTVAIEEITLIHGSSTIKLPGPDGKTTSSWEPVAALVDWSARPDFWYDQALVLVEYPPLSRLVLAASIRGRLRSLASTEIPAVRTTLLALAARPEVTAAELRAAAVQAGEATTTGKALLVLAATMDGDHRWLWPRTLESAQLEHDGRTLAFPEWFGELMDRKDRIRAGGMGAAPALTRLEEQAIVVGERLVHLQALREHKNPAILHLDLELFPRPYDGDYCKYTTEAFEKGMKPDQTLSPLESNVANTLVEYLQDLPSKDWALPGEDAMFDQKYALWLIERATWLPLGIVLDTEPSELSRARLPLAQVVAFRTSYRDLIAAEARCAWQRPRGQRGRPDRRRS